MIIPVGIAEFSVLQWLNILNILIHTAENCQSQVLKNIMLEQAYSSYFWKGCYVCGQLYGDENNLKITYKG